MVCSHSPSTRDIIKSATVGINKKFCFLLLGVECITTHAKFEIVVLDKDVLQTALVAIHNARLNPIPDPITNR